MTAQGRGDREITMTNEKKKTLALGSTFLTFALCLLPSALPFSPSALFSQAAPATEVFLAPLTISASAVSVGAAVNISNNPGYDNQPSFFPDSTGVIFASNRDQKQNDIYRWDIAKKQLVQLTHTAENEYSPLVAPDGKSFVCVHGTEQSLFRYDLDGGNPRLAYQHGKELIGYHVWITDTQIAAFVLGATGQPNTLQLIDTPTGKSETLASAIGRSLLKRPGGTTVSYVAKVSPQAWYVKTFDPKTRVQSVVVTDMPKSTEDLTWLPDGRFVVGQGQKLLMWTLGSSWKEIADLGTSGVSKITRLSASRDGKWLAIVGEPAK